MSSALNPTCFRQAAPWAARREGITRRREGADLCLWLLSCSNLAVGVSKALNPCCPLPGQIGR